MSRTIAELLHRRTDLSTFLVHLTRTQDGVSGRDRLINILGSAELRRGKPLGMAAVYALRFEQSEPDFFDSQRVICFSETPLEHTWMMCEDIADRQVHFEPYGIAITKT